MPTDRVKIEAHDAIGGWNIDKYSAQRGRSICFHTNLCDSDICKIVWTFSDDTAEPSTDNRVCRVFTKLVGQVRLPCEGFVTVRVAVTTNNGKCLVAQRVILLVPQVTCRLVFVDDYNITCDTQFVHANLHGECQPIASGNPVNGKEGYACGGACANGCPRLEVKMSKPYEACVFSYGKHCAYADVCLDQLSEEECIPLYQNNFLGTHSHYPPAVAHFCIQPRNLTLRVLSEIGRRWHKRFFIENLSEPMLRRTEGGAVTWRIYDQRGKVYWNEVNQCATLLYEFRKLDYYCIEATVAIGADCKPTIVRVYLQLSSHCDAEKDVAVYRAPSLEDLMPQSSLNALLLPVC
jgi:hypothetical protein